MFDLNQITSIFTCAGVVIACVAAIVAALEFRMLRKSTVAEHERNQKEATLAAYEEVEMLIHDTTSNIYSYFNIGPYSDPTALKPMAYSCVSSNANLVESIRTYLNVMERICGGVCMGIYNIDVFDRLYGDNALRTDAFLGDYIESRRRIRNAPDLYCDYERVIKELASIHKTRTEDSPVNERAALEHSLL